MKKRFQLILAFLFTCFFATNVFAYDQKVVDESSLLSEKEIQEIEFYVQSYIEHTGYDMVVYFTNNDGDITKIADDFFDQNGYGNGNQKDGIILCVNYEEGIYTITTHGSACIDTYTDRALGDLKNKIESYLASGDIVNACKSFAQDGASIYDNYDSYHQKSNPIAKALPPSLIGALIITLIAYFSFNRQLKNTSEKKTASSYMSNQNVNLLRSGEIYLYTSTMRKRIERQEEEKSTTHKSENGEVHGGGGTHRFK